MIKSIIGPVLLQRPCKYAFTADSLVCIHLIQAVITDLTVYMHRLIRAFACCLCFLEVFFYLLQDI